jgi:hypothetical protein
MKYLQTRTKDLPLASKLSWLNTAPYILARRLLRLLI